MDQPSWIGYKLNDRYAITELLGQGGMSAVFRADDPNLRRVVAVKLIHSHLSSDPEFVRRFEAEAAAVAQLRHPNIIQVYDFNHDGSTYYMVLEFVPGESLQARLKRLNTAGRKLSLEKVIAIGHDVCSAAQYAHRRGLIHRDIKPANVMLNVQGEAILMDFGIVKIVGEKHHTATGAVVGTAVYMSPEQVRGDRPDHRADIYSLGVMLFEMVSGRPPFEADSAMTIMMMHLNDPIPDIQDLNPDVPPELKAIIEKALAKDPNERYQNAGELAAALKGLLAAPPPAAPQPVSKPPAKPQPAATIASQPAPAAREKAPSQPPQPKATPAQPPTAAPRQQARPRAARAASPQPAPAKKKKTNMLLLGGGAVILLLICVIVGVAFIPSLFGGGSESEATQVPATPVAEVVMTNTQAPPTATLVPATATIPPTAPPTAINIPATATEAVAATIAPTETRIPTITPTATPETPYVFITGITIENGVYVVDYEAHNYPEDDPNMHVHMFFNTVYPEDAGSPAAGPWKLTWGPYGIPPFTEYGPSNKPAGATRMCALVANANHTIILGSGNCFDLPE